MKKIISSILILFILFTNLVLPISVFAAEPDLLVLEDSSGPQDNTVTLTGPMSFFASFSAPKILKESVAPNQYYNVYFQASCVYLDKTIKPMPAGGDGSGAHYIIYKKPKFKANESGAMLLDWKWNDGSVCDHSTIAPYGVNWTLTEFDANGKVVKEYLNKNFKFKQIQNLGGFYYVTIDKNGDYTVSTRFIDETLCNVSSKSFIENNSTFKILEPCKYYNDLPIYNKTNNPVSVTPVNVATNKSIYKMLVPLPGITCMDSSGQDTTCISNDIGKYLNVIFSFAIGLCAALAVIMLIIAGVSYMGDESVFGKTEAKKKMFSAILGLIIALGAWALLNTINPDLTGKGGLVIDTASVEVETQPLTSNDQYTEGTKTSQCIGGIVTAKTANGGIPVCITLQSKIIDMVAKAKEAGINLFGYGYRSKTTQEGLRVQNCGGTANIYNTSAKCNPATAIPGNSMHENGFAVDFQCDGVTIRATDNKCYVWLKNNASNYGYYNTVTSEPWHWSIPRN